MAGVSSGCCREMVGKLCEMKADSREHRKSREVRLLGRSWKSWDEHLIISIRAEAPGSSGKNDWQENENEITCLRRKIADA